VGDGNLGFGIWDFGFEILDSGFAFAFGFGFEFQISNFKFEILDVIACKICKETRRRDRPQNRKETAFPQPLRHS
jgi:hypothetical protein